MNNNLTIDARWKGNFGIGRYSSELLKRLHIDQCAYLYGNHPLNIREIVRASLSRNYTFFYTPGFVPMWNSEIQIVTLHDLIHLNESENFFKFKGKDLLYMKILKSIQNQKLIINTVSEHSKIAISRWANLPLDQITVIPNGLSDSFNANESSVHRVRRSLGFVGNNKYHKNFTYFAKIASQLKKDWKISVIGVGLEAMWNYPKDNVCFYNNISDFELSNLYKKMEILLIPSLSEGFCLPALEAAACGVKVVHFGIIPTISEILDGNDLKIDMGMKDSDVIDFLNEASKSFEEYPKIFRSGLAKKYSWDLSAQLLESQIQEILTRY